MRELKMEKEQGRIEDKKKEDEEREGGKRGKRGVEGMGIERDKIIGLICEKFAYESKE